MEFLVIGQVYAYIAHIELRPKRLGLAGVGLMISPKLDWSRPRDSAVEHAGKFARNQKERSYDTRNREVVQ